MESRTAAIAAVLLLLGQTTTATPLRSNCHAFYLDVPLTAKSWTLDIPRVNNDVDAVNFALSMDRWSEHDATQLVVASEDVEATYTHYAELCLPSNRTDKNTLQILTHGAFFDHRYWDATFDQGNYSYVKYATDAGYTVLNYDRLNNGGSDKLDAYTVGNGDTEVEALRGLTEMARAGTFNQHLHPGSTLPDVGKFDNVIHIGHSFGSAITLAFLAKYGQLSSAAVLTGLIFTIRPSDSTSSSQGFGYAATTNPSLYGQYPSGYIIPDNTNRLQTGFFHRYNLSDPAGFTDEALAYAEGIKSPVTIAEWVALKGALSIEPAPSFSGPIEFFVGEHDALICSGECYNNYNLSIAEKLYPNAKARDVYIQPGSGHGLTLHLNATAGYGALTGFLASYGL